ncbi:hypothetical protein NLI96_g4607 [Meripilus lineatus]|uniref:Uncharacterized protein n=1 Tax=Meripilus lineatus TaxID=2056292 RepID=A0AAD5V4L1_9APHY|nr:hypothetical protein NLI96_g4607 [Physisporinus lineatus]
MGGFIAYDGRRAIRPLFFDPSQQEDLELPEISSEDIEDRSKNNVISQLVIALQIVWFLSQCIARRAAGFEIPQLELITLGYVVLYAATSFFWWKKPFGTCQPVRVRVPKGWQSPWTPPHPNLEEIDSPSTLYRIFDTFFGSFIRVAKGVRYPIRGSWMSSFYPESISRSHMMWSSSIGSAIATFCGAVLLAAWSSESDLGPFRTLWRVASLITITIPIISCFLACVWSHQESALDLDDSVIHLVIPFLLFTIGVIYFVAKGVLIVFAFRGMAYLPPSSFQTISWIKSFPHWL